MITQNNYVLPIIEAVSPHEIFATGANKPLLITGVDMSTGKKGDYVVKFRAAERLSDEAFMRELVAAFLAWQLNISVITPVIVNITKDFVDLLSGNNAWVLASKSLGYNFGSKYIQGFSTIPISQELNQNQLDRAGTIFAFDILIQNSDRTNDKPNLITNGKDIVIYDHELAFSFVFDLFRRTNPWKISEADLAWVNRHFLLPKLRGKNIDFTNFNKALDNIDDTFWKRCWTLIPASWQNDQFDKIKSHINSIKDHRDSFINELQKLV